MSTVTTIPPSSLSLEVIAPDSGGPLSTPRCTHHEAPSINTLENYRRNVEEPSSRARKLAITFQLSGISLTACAINGLVVVGLPKMTIDLALPRLLSFWPVSAAFMATTASLLLAGSLADIIGPRLVELVGALTMGVFMIGCGLSQKGVELVALRALQGVSLAMHLASSVSLITMTWPQGRSRNVAFSCLGISQVIGFSLGLVLGGIFVDTIGWRAAWHIYGSITLALGLLGCFVLPKSQASSSWKTILHDITTKMDLVGALLASAFMAFVSYFLAYVPHLLSGIW